MQTFTPTRDSIDCACGGRRSNIPDVIRRHNETYKHMTWQFHSLCQQLITTEAHSVKRELLTLMRDLVRSGRVL